VGEKHRHQVVELLDRVDACVARAQVEDAHPPAQVVETFPCRRELQGGQIDVLGGGDRVRFLGQCKQIVDGAHDSSFPQRTIRANG
jgi:hypothetical protein